MPWQPSDALKHTKKANNPASQKKWAEVANNCLKEYGDEGLAIRVANSKMGKKK